MKKSIFILILIITISLLAFSVSWFQYLLISVGFLAMLYLLLFGVIFIFKNIKKKTFKLPLIIFGICFFGTIISLFRPYPDAVITTKNVSKNLEYAYETDQSDRMDLRAFLPFISKLKSRDALRLKQVRTIYAEDKLASPLDKFHAAFVFHHSDNAKDYKIASELSAQAAQSEKLKDNYTVQWLKKAAYDRYMVSIGKPEKYHTQDKFSIELE